MRFDVAIVGGGINGVAIARQCALAGRRVLLVEKHDFAAGTTSRATRIIHGGLRYLEHGEIGLVRESLRERERLLKNYPNLVRPIDFVLALPAHGIKRNALTIRAGLWLYAKMAGRDASLALQHSSRNFESGLDRGLNLSYFSYEDAQCEFPERLVIEWLSEATQAGAVARNYTSALAISIQDGKARGLTLRDELTGEEADIEAEWVVNAAGPWVDEVLAHSGLKTSRLVGGVRGTHIVLPVFSGAPSSAVYTEAEDGRPIFMVPWAGQLLVGTTEVPQLESADQVGPTAEEIRYLLSSLQRLCPAARVSASDIRFAYAGVRPLPFSPKKDLSSISRKHRLHDHLENGVAGLISVVGGKLTTAASLARSCARMVGIRIPEPAAGIVALGSAAGVENTVSQWSRMVSLVTGISVANAEAIAEWHGRRALCIARMAASSPLLQKPLCSHSDHVAAEAVEAVQREGAITLADILLRRVPVSLGACWNDECTHTAATVIGNALGWTEAQRAVQIEKFLVERSRFLQPVETANQSASRDESALLERVH